MARGYNDEKGDKVGIVCCSNGQKTAYREKIELLGGTLEGMGLIVRQDMKKQLKASDTKNASTGEKQMSNQNSIETTEEKRKGNLWSLISLLCFVGRFVICIAIAGILGVVTEWNIQVY